ncbi:hypothetical protein PO124_09065 [Bacillus licheniformis]|nr:hypothetical protein [Bacillus licheniformis]
MNRHRGWEIYEKESMIFNQCQRNYGNIECFISEMGWALKEKNVSAAKTA